jgi:glycosyltransferase involved in cell wall biosynthesis
VQGVVSGLAEGLRRQGHEVMTAWLDGDEAAGEMGLPLHVDTARNPAALTASARRSVRDLLKVRQVLARFKPDVVNIHFPRSQALYFLALRPFFGYRLLLSFHGSDAHFPNEAVKKILPLLMQRSSAITAVSEASREALRDIAPNCDGKITIIPNGIDFGFWSDAEPRRRNPHELVAAGRLVPVKGFDILLKAVALCCDSGTDVHLTLFGEGLEAEPLRRLAGELGISDRVTFAGHAEPDGLRDHYAEAGIFVLSSRSEGLPLALLEAMAAGLVPVCTEVGGVGEVMTADTGRTVPPCDPALLAEAIQETIEHWSEGSHTRAAAKKRAAAFSSSRQYACFSDLIEKL